MKSLKTLLQEVTAGIKAWANANFSLGTHVHGNITNDGKVGTTANLPLITGTGGAVQAGAFGNQANTFCEGNDSRLSDARTPVAHTHGKADITNLFNSANTWSENNTYTATINYQSSYTLGNPPQSVASQIAVKVADAAGSNYLAQIATYQDTALSGLRFTIRDKFDSNGFSPSGSNRNKYLSFLQNTSNQGYLQWDGYANNSLIPLANDTYDLGSSSYQWNNLYAKNYYYNGTAWGLDKANAWSNVNTFSNTLSITGNTLFAWDRPQVTIGTIPSSIVFYGTTRFRDSNNTSYAFERGAISTTWNYRQWFVHNFSNASINASFEIGIKHDGTEKYFLIDADRVIPNTTGVSDLGTSTNKWKTLNGINPGALSFPNLEYSNSNKWIDIASSITKTDGADNWYYPAVDGWIFIIASGGAAPDLSVLVFIGTGFNLISGVIPAAESSTGARWCQCLAPAGSSVRIRFNKGSTSCSIEKALFIPCQGNV